MRTVADEVTDEGWPVNKDVLDRHSRHLEPADDLPREQGDPSSAGLTVAAVVARRLTGWPSLAAEVAAALRSEGLTQAADTLIATTPESMRATLAAAAGTPAADLIEAVAVAEAMRATFGTAHPQAARALASACREQGADAVAGALLDLAGAVESTSSPAAREEQIRRAALRAATDNADPSARRQAVRSYQRFYGPVPSSLPLAMES